MSQSVTITLENTATLQNDLKDSEFSALPHDILVHTIQGPFFFATVETLQNTLSTIHSNPQFIVFRSKYVPFMDLPGLQNFYILIEQFQKQGVAVYLCEANPRIRKKLTRLNVLPLVKDHRIFTNLAEVLKDYTTSAKLAP